MKGRSAESREDALIDLGHTAGEASFTDMTWTPQPFQAAVMSCERGITFAVGGVGSGKSEAAAFLLMKWALAHPRRADGTPTEWLVVGPEYNLIRAQQFQKILNHARRLKGLGYGSVISRVITGQNPRIILKDGQVLYGRSGDQYERMEGIESDGTWLDEIQRQPEQAFHTALQRARSSDDIRCVAAGSPEDQPGWVWRAISGDESYSGMRAGLIRHGMGFRCFRWTSDANAANKEANLDIIGEVLKSRGAAKADQKLKGLFPGTAELPSLNVLNYVRAFVGRLELRREEAQPATLGVDIGETRDFSWLTVMSSRGVVLYMERFNAGTPGVPRGQFFTYLENRIEALALEWRVKKVLIDVAKAGKPVSHHLAGKRELLGVTFEDIDTSVAKRKPEIIEALNLAMSHGRVRVPTAWRVAGEAEQAVDEVAQMRKEFEELIVKEVEKARSFDHPPGGHDDGVVSLALAWRGVDQHSSGGGSLTHWKAPAVSGGWFGGR